MELVEPRVGHVEVFRLPAGFGEVFRRICDIIERNKARVKKRSKPKHRVLV